METISIEQLKNYLIHHLYYVKEENVDFIYDMLVDSLRSDGYDLNRIEIIGSGESSINFVKGDIVTRLTNIAYDNYDNLSDYLKHSDAIAQPIFEKNFTLPKSGRQIYPQVIRITKMPRYHNFDVSEEELKEINRTLINDGYLPFDMKSENFAKDENGKVLLIDWGQLIFIKEMPIYKQRQEFSSYKDKCSKYAELYEKYIAELIVENMVEGKDQDNLPFLKPVLVDYFGVGINNDTSERRNIK